MRPSPPSQTPLAGAKTILPQLLEHQQAHRQAELDSRQCLSGPHKDDLAVEIDGNPAKTYGSQGQTRTAALLPEAGSAGNLFSGDRRVAGAAAG